MSSQLLDQASRSTPLTRERAARNPSQRSEPALERVGLGILGAAHCHTPWIARVLKARSDVALRGVYDHDVVRASECASIVDAPVASDPRAILSDPEIHGVFVLSQTNRHIEDVIAVARAGKHVFVEKPLGIATNDAFRMARVLENSGVVFMTGYRTRSEGIFLFLREQIRRGNFGRVTRIRYVCCHGSVLKGGFAPEHRWMDDPAQAGGGAFVDLGTHALDALLWLMGERVVAATSATGNPADGNPVCEEFGEGLIRFESGAIGSLAAARVDVDQPVRCVISGTEGHAYVANGKLFFQSARVPNASADTPWIDVPPDRPLVFDLFIDVLRGRAPNDFITPAEAAEVCAVQEAMARGAASGRWVAPRRRSVIGQRSSRRRS